MPAVLYDFDGLLIDSETAGLLSWKRVYAEFGHELDLAHWLSETEAGRGPCMPTERLAELVGKPVDWEAVERRRIVWRDELLVTRPGVEEHLAEARRLGFDLAIVSNARTGGSGSGWKARNRSGVLRGHHLQSRGNRTEAGPGRLPGGAARTGVRGR